MIESCCYDSNAGEESTPGSNRPAMLAGHVQSLEDPAFADVADVGVDYRTAAVTDQRRPPPHYPVC